jgi:hypothetical protein
MSINLSKAELDALGEIGEDKGTGPVKLTVLQKILAQYATEFQTELEKNIKDRKITASGRLRNSIEPEFDDDGNTVRILIADYYDFPNKGVKGVSTVKNHERNAPNSKYQYRNFGMNDEGRASIKEYIEDGYAKIKNVRNDKAVGIGLERKGVRASKSISPIDSKVNTMIYLIKAYGIKTTNYFDDAFNKVFKDFAIIAGKAVANDIIITIKAVNKTK